MTNDEFEKKYQTSVLMAGKELAILRKVNADLLEAMEYIHSWTTDSIGTEDIDIKDYVMNVINAAANNMRFGVTEKKEGE